MENTAKLGKDLTTGSEWKGIIIFALPIMIGNLLQQFYSTVDGIVVGNYVGEDALAAVGTCTPLTFLFLAFAIGLSAGSGIMISQLFGAKRYEELKSALSTTLCLLLALGLAFTLIGIFGARWILRELMNVRDENLLDMSVAYFAIYCGGLVFQYAYNAISYVLRGVGDSRATLYFLAVATVMNLGLDLLFVIVFRWGVAGAAIATVLAQLCCTAASVLYMFRRYPIFRFGKGEFVFDRDKCGICLRLGIPTTVQQCVIALGNVFIQRLINSYGQATIAACTVGVRIDNYLFVPILGLNIAMSTFTGQNIGAGRMDRIRRGLLGGHVMNLIIVTALSALTWLFAPQIAALFGVGGEALSQSVEYVRFLCFFFILFGVYMTTGGLLQGSGDVVFSTCCSLTTLSIRVAAAYFFAYVLDMGYASCWRSVPIGWAAVVVMSLARYFSGRWKTKSIIKQSPREVET